MQIGDKVQAANFSHMICDCPTYHSRVAFGEVVDITPGYAASIIVVWHNKADGPQGMAYAFEPSQLVKL